MTAYYVDTAVGNDANAGTAEGAGNAWATIGKFNTDRGGVSSRDICFVKASGTYTEDIAFTTNTNAYSKAIVGYTSTPGDNGRVNWTCTTNCGTFSAAQVNWIFANFNFEGGTGDIMSGTGADLMQFFNCRFYNAGGWGINLDDYIIMTNCQFDNNTSGGATCDGTCVFYGCVGFANSGVPFESGNAGTVAVKNVAYNNGTAKPFDLNGCPLFAQNTIDGENTGAVGFEALAATQCLTIDNIFHDLTTGADRGSNWTSWMGLYNLFNSCTTNYAEGTYSGTTSNMSGFYGDVLDVPGFRDEDADDYVLTSDSAAASAGCKPGLL